MPKRQINNVSWRFPVLSNDQEIVPEKRIKQEKNEPDTVEPKCPLEQIVIDMSKRPSRKLLLDMENAFEHHTVSFTSFDASPFCFFYLLAILPLSFLFWLDYTYFFL